jgi:hypothetical protein
MSSMADNGLSLLVLFFSVAFVNDYGNHGSTEIKPGTSSGELASSWRTTYTDLPLP